MNKNVGIIDRTLRIVAGLALIALTVMQGKGSGAGRMFGSDSSIQRTRRGMEKTLFNLTIIMAVVNLVLSLPYLLFVVVIASILGRSLINVILIFGITDSPIFARVTRGEVLRIRESGYVESAVSIGARTPRIAMEYSPLGAVPTVSTVVNAPT